MTTRILWPNGGRNNGVLMYWCRADLFRRRVCWHSSICWPVNIACLDEKHEFKELLDAINAVKESKAPGRCGIPAEIWKHTWRYETRLLDFLRREKFCSKAWFKQEHTTANFPCAQGTFYLTSFRFQSPTQGYHLALTRSSGSSAPFFRTMVGPRRSIDTVLLLGG